VVLHPIDQSETQFWDHELYPSQHRVTQFLRDNENEAAPEAMKFTDSAMPVFIISSLVSMTKISPS
jgi:hypothetical protein